MIEGLAVRVHEEAGRPLRADAERNRRRIIEAAARLFARKGLDASFDDVAREAGVGVGTVYRRFPDREQLLQALFEDRLESMIAVFERVATAEDAMAGLREFAERTVEQHVTDRGLKELIFGQAECAERISGVQARVIPIAEDLVARAKAQGALRPDVGLADVMMAVFMASSAGALTADTDPQQWRRQFAVIWAGLCVPSHASSEEAALPAEAMSFTQLTAAFNQGPEIGRAVAREL